MLSGGWVWTIDLKISSWVLKYCATLYGQFYEKFSHSPFISHCRSEVGFEPLISGKTVECSTIVLPWLANSIRRFSSAIYLSLSSSGWVSTIDLRISSWMFYNCATLAGQFYEDFSHPPFISHCRAVARFEALTSGKTVGCSTSVLPWLANYIQLFLVHNWSPIVKRWLGLNHWSQEKQLSALPLGYHGWPTL